MCSLETLQTLGSHIALNYNTVYYTIITGTKHLLPLHFVGASLTAGQQASTNSHIIVD